MGFWAKFTRYFSGSGDYTGYQNGDPISIPVAQAKTYTPDAATQLGTVWACVNLISQTIASIPIDVFSFDKNGKRSVDRQCNLDFILNASPNQDMTSYEFWQTMAMNRLLRGNAYAHIIRKDDGTAYILYPLSADQMSVKRELDNSITYEYTDRFGKIIKYQPEEIMHWKGIGNGLVGLSPIEYMRSTLTEAMAAQENAIKIFVEKGKIYGVISPNQVLNQKQKVSVAKSFQQSGDHVAVLDCGMEFHAMSLSPADTQLLETRKFSTSEICRWFGVPPALVGAESGDYEKLERWFYKATILPLCVSAEKALMKRVATQDERHNHEVRFRLGELNRADDQTRAAIYATHVQNGLRSRNEIRNVEGWNSSEIPEADSLTVQSNLMPLESLGKTEPSQEGTMNSINPEKN